MTLSQALNVLSTCPLNPTERNQLNCATHYLTTHNTLLTAHLNALLTMTERLMFDTQGTQPDVIDMTYLFAEQKGTLINA